MSESKVNWYEDKVMARVEGASKEMLTRLAFQGESHAKANIQANNQIDTGFMLNSVYGKGPMGSHYGQTGAPIKPGQEKAGEAAAEKGAAVIHASARYAVYQEIRKSFLYRALEQLKADFPGIVKEVEIK